MSELETAYLTNEVYQFVNKRLYRSNVENWIFSSVKGDFFIFRRIFINMQEKLFIQYSKVVFIFLSVHFCQVFVQK